MKKDSREWVMKWLQGSTWDKRMRSLSAKSYIRGEGYATVDDMDKRVNVPGFKRESFIGTIDLKDIGEDTTWDRHFVCPYTHKSYRTKKGLWAHSSSSEGPIAMIKEVYYCTPKGLMRVIFTKHNTEVIYDHVPKSVYDELEYVARSEGAKSVGALFWQLVRYKGSRGSSKFPYWNSGEVKEYRQYTPKDNINTNRMFKDVEVKTLIDEVKERTLMYLDENKEVKNYDDETRKYIERIRKLADEVDNKPKTRRGDAVVQLLNMYIYGVNNGIFGYSKRPSNTVIIMKQNLEEKSNGNH